jgi:N-acyl-D-aspartate/D-glutamate deacylase
MTFDLIIKGGLVVDGTLFPRRIADVGVRDGRISKIGQLENAATTSTINATGMIVAPGVIDIHTHYDAQIQWDPYCTSSCWHGITTVAMGNCGFGYAPCHPSDRDRYMGMMVNSEQVPLAAQKAGLTWSGESFPSWLDHLRSIPKGLNVGQLVPLNALLVYVLGDRAKERPATAAERAKMRELFHQAMDAGASGFSFCFMGRGNGHVDYDGSPVPTDLMDPEEAYNLARVLRERDEGVIEALTEGREVCNRHVSEELARISRRPIIHNVCIPYDAPTGAMATPEATAIAERWRETIAWAEEREIEGLNIFVQCLSFRPFNEIKVEDSTLFMSVPVLEEFQNATSTRKLEMIRDPQYRLRANDAYKPEHFVAIGGGVEKYTLSSAKGANYFTKFEGQLLGDIGSTLKRTPLDTFFDILDATELQADFRVGQVVTRSAQKVEQMLRSRRALAGVSDGGAHVKMFVGAIWPTDMLTWLCREEKRFTLEEMHYLLSYKSARAFGMDRRGALIEDYWADIMIYDLDHLGYDTSYEVVHDLPGGEWRRIARARGVKNVIVNGKVAVHDGIVTDAFSGTYYNNTGR